MKRLLSVLLVLVLVMSFAFAKGGKEENKAAEPVMTHEELVKAAQEEGRLVVYTFTSRGSKVGELFEKKYGIKTEVTQLGDSAMITKVTAEAKANVEGADLVFAQDSGRVLTELFDTGYLTKYVPSDVAAKIPSQYADPLVYDLNIKAFIFNDEKATDVKNVWQLTEPQWKDKIQFKNPQNESVGMNFFVMLTKPEWAEKLAKAYKDLYGKDLVLTTPNAGYEFIKMLMKNAVLGKSDTTVCEAVGTKGQADQLYGLFTINKLRTAKDKNLAVSVNYDMVPFNGFMYPIFTGLTVNAKHPNAAKLFLEFAYTEEGWKPMDTLGDNSPILGSSEDTRTVSDWEKTLVVEDANWLAAHRYEVEEFVNGLI